MKFRKLIIVFILTIITTSCSNAQNTSTQNITDTDITKKTDNYVLIQSQSTDINNDGISDIISLFSYYNETENTLTVKLEAGEKSIEYSFNSPALFNSVKEFKLINLDKDNKDFLVLLHNDTGEAESAAAASIYSNDIGTLVFGIVDSNLELILDLTNMSFNEINNYEIKYIEDYLIEFTDKATNFNAKYNIYYSEPLSEEYKKRLENLDSFGIPEAMRSLHFYEISVVDENSDGSDEIICSKYIPGIYHNDVLGVIDYYYKYSDNKYLLYKEILNYNKLLELPPIKEMEINE